MKRVAITPDGIKVSKPGFDVDTCGVGDLALWIGMRQGQAIETGYKTVDTVTPITGFIDEYVATVTFPTLPQLADALVQPVVYFAPDLVSLTEEICGIGFTHFSAFPGDVFYQTIDPGPLTVDLATTSLTMTIQSRIEVEGFRYVLMRKPTDS